MKPHYVGAVYELTKENMNHLIKQLEELQKFRLPHYLHDLVQNRNVVLEKQLGYLFEKLNDWCCCTPLTRGSVQCVYCDAKEEILKGKVEK